MTVGERNKIIIEMRKNGHRYADIMQRLGCNKHTVANAISDYNLKGDTATRSKRTVCKNRQERNEDILRLFEEGLTMTDIAKQYGLSISAVSRVISKDKPKEPEPEPEVKESIVIHVGDMVMFSRNREMVFGKVTKLNPHTVTLTVDHGRYKETCCPKYLEIEAVV